MRKKPTVEQVQAYMANRDVGMYEAKEALEKEWRHNHKEDIRHKLKGLIYRDIPDEAIEIFSDILELL